MAHTDVRTVALGRWPGILKMLGINDLALSGKHGPCPMCGGNDRFRFDDKQGRGTYYCSGCGAGDGINLAMKLTGLPFRDAARRIEAIAGVIPHSIIKAESSDEDKRNQLRQAWKGAAPIQQGDAVVSYLRGRGLRLDTLPSSLRFHPGMAYRDGDEVRKLPAMLAMVTGADGKARSLHRTYLQGAQKAAVSHPKKLMQGMPLTGAAIRLAGVSNRIGIAEGIETALAAAELFDLPVWSCISTSGVETFEPPVGVREVVIFADNDPNFAGQKAAYTAAHRLTLKGYHAQVRIPQSSGDWLDTLIAGSKLAE